MTAGLTRRTFLRITLHAPAVGLLSAGLSGCGKQPAQSAGESCADTSSMTDAEQQTRQVVGYVEASPDTLQVCAGCAFFHPGSGQCGTCDMFSGGVVNSRGHCTSWSARS